MIQNPLGPTRLVTVPSLVIEDTAIMHFSHLVLQEEFMRDRLP